jgi:phosphoserine phosphatase RsbU/P
MNILVADDDPIARKVLRAFLEKAGYQVQMVEDGSAAMKVLLAPESPPVALIDWMMPGMTGPEVCGKLRSANLKIRPYIMILSSKSDRVDMVAGLDSGADDFLTKPFNGMEMLARLRVAERTSQYQRELHKNIDELEVLVARHRLLGELMAQPAADESKPENAATAPRAELSREAVDLIVLRTFAELGMSDAKRAASQCSGSNGHGVPFATWAGIILSNEETSIDLVLEMCPSTAAVVFARALHRSAQSESDVDGFLAETQTIISTSLQNALQTQGAKTLMPLLSRSRRTGGWESLVPAAAESESHPLDLAGCPARFTLIRQSCPIHQKTPGQLHELDILADAYPPAATGRIPLLSRGVVLNDRYIAKLTAFDGDESEGQSVATFEPSALARHFYARTLVSA